MSIAVLRRARNEYRIELQFEGIPYELACWLKSDDQKTLDTSIINQRNAIVTDRADDRVFLAKSEWEYNYLHLQKPGYQIFEGEGAGLGCIYVDRLIPIAGRGYNPFRNVLIFRRFDKRWRSGGSEN